MKRNALRTSALVLTLVVVVPAGAQEAEVDESRINGVLFYAEERASSESDGVFTDGEYPKVIQNLRIRHELRPWDESIATDLIWMLGNIEYDGDALAVAVSFREKNPLNPDRGFPEAQLYVNWRMFTRVPRVLEEDILRTPPPHSNSFSLLSAAYSRMGFDADVVRVLDVALKHYPDFAAFKRNRQIALERLKG